MLTNVEKPTTVFALLTGAAASFVGILVTFGVLIENWMEPGCDAGNPDRNATYCDINGADYARALPFAIVTLVVVLLTAVLCIRVLQHAKTHGSSRSARIQVALAVALPVLALGGLVAATIAPMYQ